MKKSPSEWLKCYELSLSSLLNDLKFDHLFNKSKLITIKQNKKQDKNTK